MDKLEPLPSMGVKQCSYWAEVKVGFPFDSQCHFGTQPGKLKSTAQIHVHRKHIQISKKQSQPMCLSTDGWEGNRVHTLSGVSFNINRREAWTQATSQVKPEDFVLSETIQSQKDKHRIPQRSCRNQTLRDREIEWWLPENMYGKEVGQQ